MNRYEEVFARIADDVEVTSTSSFVHSGLGSLSTTREMDLDASEVLSYLWRFLYLYYYAGDVVAATVLLSGSRLVVAVPEWEEPALAAEFIAANDAKIYPSPGWSVTGNSGSKVLVSKDGLTLAAEPTEVVSTRPEGPTTGDSVAVLLPAYRRFVEPRWFVAIGAAGSCARGEGPVTRLYFSTGEVGTAKELLAALSAMFNRRAVPHQIKLLNHPDAYVRRDPFVVYLGRDDWLENRPAIEEVHAAFAPRLRDDGPSFLGELGRGWCIADEPVHSGQPMSFGQHRCLLIAEALVSAHRMGRTTAAGRFEAIAERYREAGLSTTQPFVNDPENRMYEVLT